MVVKKIITEKITLKLNSDDDLPLNKSLKFHAMTIIITSVFEKGGKLYLQVVQTTVCMSYKNGNKHKTNEH